MKKLQEITADIQKAVPEIMELKFGCKIKAGNDLYVYVEYAGDILTTNPYDKNQLVDIDEGCGCCSDKRYWDKNLKPFQGLEILGRDITLEDILKVLPDGYLVDSLGRIWKLNAGHPGKESRWHLGKPLHEQSEEAINFLHLIICQN